MRNQGLRLLSVVGRYTDGDMRAAIAARVRDNPHAFFSGLPLPTESRQLPSCRPR